MKKLIILILCGTTAFSFSAKASALNVDYSEVETLFENIEEMTSAYEETYDIKWNATKIQDITDVYNEDYEKIGYLVIFDEGYVSYGYDFELYDVSHVGYPSYYKKKFFDKKVVYTNGAFEGDNNISTLDSNATNIYYPLIDKYDDSKFAITTCMVQIPYFKDINDSSDWGNYQGITFNYVGMNSGAVLSTMSLMYTLKVNNGVNLTPLKTSYLTFLDQLHVFTNFNYDINPQMDPLDLHDGINHYLNHSFGDTYRFSALSEVNDNVPAVTLYQNSNPQSANYCMRVGFAKESTWWLFYTYYDIVMANHDNFFMDEYDIPTMWYDTSLAAYYYVKQSYRQEMFQFFEGKTLLK